MTGSQYKSIIEHTLMDKTLNGVTDSLTVARTVLKNCGVPLPQGDCAEIISALSSNDFAGWRQCTREEAQEYANNGIAAIGISSESILIIEPQETEVLSSESSGMNGYKMDLTGSLGEGESSMMYYAYMMSTTTQITFKITNKPAANRMEPQQSQVLILESNMPDAYSYTTWSSSKTAVATVQPTQPPKVVINSHSYGNTVITASCPRYGKTDSFTLEVSKYKIVDKPIDDTMLAGETKTIRIDTNLPVQYDLYWYSSNTSVATVSPVSGSGLAEITALSPGTTYISAASPMNGRSDGFTLTVLDSNIYFDANGGVGGPNIIYIPPYQYGLLPNEVPTREGYVFKGWGTSSTATEVTYYPGTMIQGGVSKTLYAVWEERMKIYISPANHTKLYTKPDGTNYPVNEWNEKKNMEIVGDYLKSFLDNYQVDVYLDKTDRSGGAGTYQGRPEEANTWITNKSKGFYLALHSNAGAGGTTKASGSVAYYNRIGNLSTLATAFVDAIDPLLPGPSNRSQRTIIGNYNAGVEPYNGNLGELRKPEEYGIPSILIETAFHDNPAEAAFLITNQQLLAEAIGGVLVNYFGLVAI